MLRCAKTEWSPHYLEASSEYCESFHETSLSALVLDVVNLLCNFIEVTLRRYSTLLPLSAAVKEQNWKQKSPQNDCLVWMNGSGPRVSVIETSDTSQQSGPAPCILSSEDADFQERTRGGKYCHLDLDKAVNCCHNLTVSNLCVIAEKWCWIANTLHDATPWFSENMTPKIQICL